MHETLLNCKCDAMHEHLGSFKQNPSQKFCKNLINFEKSKKKIQRPINLDLYEWNAWKKRKTRSYQWRKNQSRLKITWEWGLEWERRVWEGEETSSVKRDQGEIYRNIHSLMHREVSRIKMCQKELSRSYWEVSTVKWPWWIEQVSRIYRAYRNFLDGSRSCRAVIEPNSQNLDGSKLR